MTPLHPHLPASSVIRTQHRTVEPHHQHSLLEGATPLLFSGANRGPEKGQGTGPWSLQRAGAAAGRGQLDGQPGWGGLTSLAGRDPEVCRSQDQDGSESGVCQGRSWLMVVGANPSIPLLCPLATPVGLSPPHQTLSGSSPASRLWLLPLNPPTLGPRCRGRLAQFPMGP